jgi:hypothetical protein
LTNHLEKTKGQVTQASLFSREADDQVTA